jgi:thymidine kinase
MNIETGELNIFIGSMFSGKTSKLINIYNKYKYCNKNIIVINYILDKRYTDKSILYTHDKREIPCVLSKNLFDTFDLNNDINNKKFMDTSVILINEAQFFKDIVKWVKIAVSPPFNKIIYLSGLDGDYKREVFGNWLELVPFCDSIHKLTAICNKCKCNDAIFSHRLISDSEQELIGNDIYIPLCRLCYDEINK